ncbi:nitroreductase/quinone reductase family protein [Streptomyces sp. NRRL S-104]|nr:MULTISPECIES: nitroreductase/quinone reductase family protein [unclassified Streptomyces]
MHTVRKSALRVIFQSERHRRIPGQRRQGRRSLRRGRALLLTTPGARSGKPHTVPLGFLRDGGTPLVVASAAGADRHPARYHNLLARPLVQVETGTEECEAVAVPAAGARRDELFAQVVRAEPG